MISSSPPIEDTRPQQQHPSPNDNTNTSNNPPIAKRKPSRRANTAERRATHNAVERARRETLNGRFLDLAQLLPNICQIRRPSKSAIVNSSIAHVNASSRHRLLAQRELRSLKNEADALRRELNEWRDRAALPRIEEPQRAEGFATVLNAELDVIPVGLTDEDGDEDNELYNDLPENTNTSGSFYPEPEQQISPVVPPPAPPQTMFSPLQGPPTPPVSAHGRPQHAGPVSFNQMMPRGSISNMPATMIVNSNQVHFDPAHPANMHGMPQYAPHSPHNVHFAHHDQQTQQSHLMPDDTNKSWSLGFAQQSANVPINPFSHQPWHEFIPGTGSPSDLSDSASASSGSGGVGVGGRDGRARSGSLSTNGGGFGSPPRSPGSFELGRYEGGGVGYDGSNGAIPGDFGVQRGLSINTNNTNNNTAGGMGQMLNSPIGAPGGGGFGNVMMMGMI